MELYTPDYAVNLQNETQSKLMVGLQGPTKSGKTTSALTFPNPFVVDFDGNLTGHLGKNILSAPFYKKDWCMEQYSKLGAKKNLGINLHIINRRDLFQLWLEKEANKLSPEQTLIVDSWTTVQDAFDIQTALEPVYTKKGEIDDFAFWATKIDYCTKICSALAELKCRVVVTFHEQFQVDKEKQPTGKIEPLMQGKFTNKLALYFTDFFRCRVLPVKDKSNKQVYAEDGKTPLVEYVWQTKPDGFSDCGSRLHNVPMFVPQHYSIFEKYATQNLPVS